MKRRDFIKVAGAACGTSLMSSAGANTLLAQSSSPIAGKQPNILFILVDELRYPSAFPNGITNAGDSSKPSCRTSTRCGSGA